MGIINGIKQMYDDWQDVRKQKYLARLEGDIRMITSKLAYDPYKTFIPQSLNQALRVSQEIAEGFVWYSGNQEALVDFYDYLATNGKRDEYNMFWVTAPRGSKVRRVHTGLPKLVSDKMPVILFGTGYKIIANAFNDDGSINDELSQQVNDLIAQLSKEESIDIQGKLDASAVIESWSGDVAWKILIDGELTPYPIIQAVDPRNYEPLYKKNILIGIKFKEYIEIENNNRKEKYCINETYTTDSNGDAIILYDLEKTLTNGKQAQSPLSAIQETRELIDNPYIKIIDDYQAMFVFKGLKGMLAFRKPNKSQASDLFNSLYGKSDHHGNFDNYDALDEIYSMIVGEIRDNRTYKYIPEALWPRDDDGKLQSLDKYATNVIKLHSDQDQNTKREVTFTQIPDKTVQHLEKYKAVLGMCCANAEISPLTLGLTDVVGMNNSDKTLQERSKTTLEMRKRKLESWKAFLTKVMYQLIQSYEWLSENTPNHAVNREFEPIKISPKQLDILVTFGEYIEQGINDRLMTWGSAKQQGTASLETVVDNVWEDDKSEEWKQLEVSRIKIEQGMGLDNPELLQLNVPLTNDTNEEEQ